MQHRPPSFAFAIPCHNEQANIGALLEVLSAVRDRNCYAERIVVVSDASTDGTDEIVATFAAAAALSIIHVRRDERLGKSSAINRCLEELVDTKIVVMLSADILPTAGCVERILAAFDVATVGVAGGRNVPSGDIALWSVRVSRVLWTFHHFMALSMPKTTEITAFRNIGIRLDESCLVDEAEIERLIRATGLTVAYIPDAIIQTPAPLTLQDYWRQRVRVTIGHARLRQRSSFEISTFSFRARAAGLRRYLKESPRDVPALVLGVLLELAIYVVAFLVVAFRPEGSGVWSPIATTKRPLNEDPRKPSGM